MNKSDMQQLDYVRMQYDAAIYKQYKWIEMAEDLQAHIKYNRHKMQIDEIEKACAKVVEYKHQAAIEQAEARRLDAIRCELVNPSKATRNKLKSKCYRVYAS